MNSNLKLSRRIASAVLLGVILAGCTSAPTTAPSDDLLHRIESASTKSDHEGLAAYYDREAAAARASAATHRKMATTYQAYSGKGNPSMAAHCNAIVRDQEAIATEYEAMAAAHRQMGQ